MQIEIRLKKLIQDYKLNRRGLEKYLADQIKVHRHTIGKILRNQTSNPSLEVMGKICDWLVNNGVPTHILPGALFGVRSSHFWQAVSDLGSVTIFLGEYHQKTDPSVPALRWISRQDAAVEGQIVQLLSNPASIGVQRVPQIQTRFVHFRYVPGAPSVSEKHFRDDIRSAKKKFNEILSHEDRVYIFIGSQRVNYLTELFISDLFGVESFKPSADTNLPGVPFYTLYREHDVDLPSCLGGKNPPPGDSKNQAAPGLYHRGKKDSWIACPWQAGVSDAGIVITRHDPGTGSLQVALFGFSARGTVAIGTYLIHNADSFWPPYAQVKGKQIGVYVCKFEFVDDLDEEGETLSAKNFEIIPIEERILRQSLS